MESLEGKTAVVTGAASGMGRAFANRFARAGMKVVLSDVTEDQLETATAEITAGGGQAIGVVANVVDAAAMDSLRDAAISAFDQVNVVCLNAGVTGSIGTTWALSEHDWAWTLDINLKGVINGIRSFVPHLLAHGDGHVVNTASIAGHTSAPYGGPYNVSKFGVVTLSETLYHELVLAKSSVGVTCLCPGFVDTNIVRAARERDEDGPVAKDAKGERWLDIAERSLAEGTDPADVAELVHDAVLANQFYLFTDDAWDAPIAKRHDEIQGRRPPTISLPTT